MALRMANRSNHRAIVLVTVVALAATVPIAMTDMRNARAGSLVTFHERTAILDALHIPGLALVTANEPDPSGDDARLAIDGREDTEWVGRPGELEWKWVASFARPVHIGLLRASFGASPTSGVPTAFHWEARLAARGNPVCDATPAAGDDGWVTLDGTVQGLPPQGDLLAQPTRRSWFVDADACALRLVVDRTNAGPPVVREVRAIESARDLLLDAEASDDGAYPGFAAGDAIDGTYGRRWAGAPGKSRWTLRVDLPAPMPIDRVRLVLGFDATSVPRPTSGRSYAVSWFPVHYVLESSEDGHRWTPMATEPLRSDGSIVPLRRRLVTLPEPRMVRALRLVMTGATGASGVPETGAVPVVREIAAYRADDTRPILSAPWVLSVNANPSSETHALVGGEMMNDAYWAKFLQRRFSLVVPTMRRDDRFDRQLDARGQPIGMAPRDDAGRMLEAIEGDDPQLDPQLLSQSSPPPITVLSGSNDWDYAGETGPDRAKPRRWHWDPLRDARAGGMGQLAPAVRQRLAPFMGFCGGAQILGLLEARGADAWSAGVDQRTIDAVLRRTSGRLIRGFAPPIDSERAWPSDPHPPRAKIRFSPDDKLFEDLAGPVHRSTTMEMPEWHSDALRSDAFLPAGPLQRFEVLATSAFCGPDVVAASPRDGVVPNPAGPGWCDTVPEAFRSRDHAWPILGTQFHAEQRDFPTAGPGDPPESVADARLFFAAAYEQMVDAYLKLAP